jgi:RNA polymerase sigma-70 factor (sigma-E family)
VADDEAFVGFVRANSESLFRTACLLTGSKTAAEDLLQETLAKLYGQWERVERVEAPLAYVRRCLNNMFVTSMRRARRDEVSVAEPPDLWLRAGPDFADVVANRELIWQLLDSLTPRQRAAVVMRHLHDLSDEDIGNSLDCRPASVRSLLSRAMISMRAEMKRQREVDGSQEHMQ